MALGIFLADWWLVRRRRNLETSPPLDPHKDIAGSIISLDKCKSLSVFLAPSVNVLMSERPKLRFQ